EHDGEQGAGASGNDGTGEHRREDKQTAEAREHQKKSDGVIGERWGHGVTRNTTRRHRTPSPPRKAAAPLPIPRAEWERGGLRTARTSRRRTPGGRRRSRE